MVVDTYHGCIFVVVDTYMGLHLNRDCERGEGGGGERWKLISSNLRIQISEGFIFNNA